MSVDILSGAEWQCASTAPGELESPAALDSAGLRWTAAAVPGTAAAAMLSSGAWEWGREDEALLDGRDWWFRCRFDAQAGERPHRLVCEGLATIADVWVNGEHVLRSENMFRTHSVEIAARAGSNELAIRFAALEPLLALRRPRPRWKSRLVRSHNLRWLRTTIIGRAPGWARWAAPVGPWRPVRLLRDDGEARIRVSALHARCRGDGGEVRVAASVSAAHAPREAVLRVDGHEGPLAIDSGEGGAVELHGALRLQSVERWWPHTHGSQRRYPVALVLDGTAHDLGAVGFRTVRLDRADGAFALEVNGVPIFCRGACWVAPEPVSLAPSAEQLRGAIRAAREAGLNMLRVSAYTWYESAEFWDACDELGVLVWQDCMFAAIDPPDDPDFLASVCAELRDSLAPARGRPSLAVLCGGSETYQQPAMLGFPPERWECELLEAAIPETLAELAPDVPYVPSSPSGGELPFDVGAGVCHYFGVGAYMRALADARLAGVRFAAECLAFAAPPEPQSVLDVFGGSRVAGHDPRWKSTVARDAGTSWDFEDVRDHYVAELFGVDPREMRYDEPDRALDLGRAALAEIFSSVLGAWREPRSRCAGALVLSLRDLWPGAGWGMIDSLGRPKSTWYAFARACAPRAVLIADGGLSGPRVHVFNDRAQQLAGRLVLTAFDVAGHVLERAEQALLLQPHSATEVGAWVAFGGFRDLGGAYRFGPAAYDVLTAELLDDDGAPIRDDDGGAPVPAVHPLAGPQRPRLPEIGLAAELREGDGGDWELVVSSRLFAQYVAFEIPGFIASDAWFHLPPTGSRTVRLGRDADAGLLPSGSVRALNSLATAPVAAASTVP